MLERERQNCLLIDDMIIYVENPKGSSDTLLKSSEVCKTAGHNLNKQDSFVC